ncbi:winged helix-turn-helix transcriptional regulator [Sphingobacterium suaedae]|uniref:Winged helix-turn-helix transcriptional regulator n=1 Tax=Sphingobacterium suaedae TaxID=1686402 RepID=A0ABW5KJ05_9SPHI
MAQRKENSTNYVNEIYWKQHCGISHILAMIGGRWKINILLYLLHEHTLRYHALRTRLVGISEKMLNAQLKELEKDGLVDRIMYAAVPPKVEYRLTELGRSLEEILTKMDEWGEQHIEQRNK